MASEFWGTWFWAAFDAVSGSDINRAFGFEAVETLAVNIGVAVRD
jgi:hypothetical protein